MKTELSLPGFRLIPAAEQQEINGGLGSLAAALIATAVAAALGEIFDDWDNFVNGLTGQPEEKK